MEKIAGVTTTKTASGKITKVTVNMKRWGHLMEDVLDAMVVETVKAKNDFIPFEPLKKKLDKKNTQ